MARISPHSLKPGQFLAEDVYNFDSRLLFSSGTQLSNKHIEILMMWGVERVSIEGDCEESDPPQSSCPSSRAKLDAERSVKKRFKLVKSSHPVVLALREIASTEAAKLGNFEVRNPQS